MSLLPDTINGKIEFVQSKIPAWQLSATQIGTTSAAVTSLNTKLTTAQTKLAAAILARETAKTATVDLHLAMRDLVNATSDIVKAVRAKAAVDGDGVYVLAQLPPPALPTPRPAPGTPTDFVATLNPDGSLKLKWKCANPPGAVGTMYQVMRRVGAAGEFVTIGGSGTKSFVDATLPAGAAAAGGVTYQVVAVRSTATGAAARFTVNLGVSGVATTSAVQQGGAKLAA